MKTPLPKPIRSVSALLVATVTAFTALLASGDTQVYNTAGTFNWVCPPGVTSIQVECWGGGGAGGGAAKTGSANVGGGGGGGGAYAVRTAMPVTPGNTYTITIPNAATCPGTFANDARFDGAAVTFTGDGGVVVTAAGGVGGQCKVATSTTLTGAGGAGGTTAASVGDTLKSGGNGAANTTSNGGPGGAGASDLANGNSATANNSTAGATTTGSDANHNGGAGGAGRTGENTGAAGTAPGGGGGGGKTTTASTTKIGGTGGLGRIILTYTVPLNVKANNTDNLNLASSWSIGVPNNSTAKWTSTVTGANTTVLGADLTFAGIQIADPGGLVTINSGNLLTLGADAIDLDLSAATQNLVLNCDVAMGSTNVWDVATGRSVTLAGTLSGTSTITKQGAGEAILSGTSTYSGATTVTAGTLTYPSGSTFSPGGNGGVSGLLTLNGSSAIASIAGTYNATGNGTAYFEIKGGGTLNFSGSANLSGTGGVRLGEGNTGTLSMTGGSMTANMNSGSNFVVGRSTGGNGILNISGGTLSITNSGGFAIANATGNNGVVTLSGTGQLVLSGAGNFGMGGGTATLNLNAGGTFTLGTASTASGTSTINFNGGTLKAGRSSATFLPASLSAANVLTGGALLDTNGYSITLPVALLGSSGDGGLKKSGTGTLTLAGANTYTGGTMVNGGSLKFAQAIPATTNVSVAAGAEAGVLVGTTDGQWTNTGDLTLQNNGGVVIDYGSTAPSLTVAPVKVVNFTIGTSAGIRLTANPTSALVIGQTYPLVTWTGSGPVDGTAFVSNTHRLAGTFSVSSNTLFFTVTANTTGSPISWNSGNGAWDTSSLNWVDAALASTTYFDTLDTVVFGDASGVTGNPTVSLATTVTPLATTLNTTGRNYTIAGSGSIGGSGSLSLPSTNTGTLTLATANNSFTGGTTINSGTLALGDATNTLPDAGAVVVDGATAQLNLGTNSDTVGSVSLKNGASITASGTLTGSSYAFESGSVSANLAGTIGLTKSTSGTVILSGVNTYAGASAVSAGTLVMATPTAWPAASAITLSIGTTLQLSSDTPFAGSQVFSGSSGASATTLVSDRATPGAGLIHSLGAPNFGSNTFNFTKGTNVISGTAGFSFSGAGLTSGAAGTAILNPVDVTVSITGPVAINGNSAAKTLALAGATSGNVISGAISNGINTLTLTKSGTSIWTLSGANTYSGTTTVSGGILNLTGSLSNAALGNIVVQAGGNLSIPGTVSGSTSTTSLTYGTTAGTATVNVSGSAALTLAALQGANIASAVSIYNQTGGTVTINTTGTAESAYTANIGYGMMNLSGGSYTVNTRYTVALNGTGGGKGVLRVGGGAGPATLTAGDIIAISRGAGAVGEMTVLANGTVNYTATGANNLLINGNNVSGAGYLNLVGGTLSSPSTTRSISFGNGTATDTSIGMINLGSGTLELGKEIITNTIASGTNRAFINLSGGTVKLLATTTSNLLLPASNGGFTSLANTVFGKITNSRVDHAGTGATSSVNAAIGITQDFAGGVTINTNGFDSTINGPLVAPTGGGVAQGNLSITDPGAGYAGAPLVTFSNPAAANATPAAGYALVSGGQLTGIVLTSPGAYAPTDTVTVTLTGGGATTPATVADIAGASLAANTSGGLVKTGTGTLTLGGANTYTGNTTVNAGTLSLADNAQLKFVLGATSGVNNSLTGAGTATLDGDFVIDTTAADALASGSWVLENVASLSGAYGATFTVVGFTDAGGDKWTKTNGAKTYTFDETTGTLTLVSTAGDAYSTWASSKGLDNSDAAHSSAKGDDPDGDGRNNLYEFAFDGNPLAGATDGKIVGKIGTVGGNPVWTLTLPVRSGAAFASNGGDQLSALIDGVYYRIEGDATLSTFANTISEVTGGDATAIQSGLPALSSGWSYRTFRDATTVSGAAKAFLRARVSETP